MDDGGLSLHIHTHTTLQPLSLCLHQRQLPHEEGSTGGSGGPWIAPIPPMVEPIPAKPIFFDLAYHQIVEDGDHPATRLAAGLRAELGVSSVGAAAAAAAGADAQQQPGLVKGLLGSWWGGR